MNENTRKNSLRLQGYDYSRPGYYFITICTKDGEAFFGEIADEKMRLSDYGNVAVAALQESASIRQFSLDCFVVMPNHVHFIAGISEASLPPGGSDALAKKCIPAMVQAYKAAVTRAIEFSLWHRSYYDEIIKTQERLERIRAYIADNPARWENDRLHPHNFEAYVRKHPL